MCISVCGKNFEDTFVPAQKNIAYLLEYSTIYLYNTSISGENYVGTNLEEGLNRTESFFCRRSLGWYLSASNSEPCSMQFAMEKAITIIFSCIEKDWDIWEKAMVLHSEQQEY